MHVRKKWAAILRAPRESEAHLDFDLLKVRSREVSFPAWFHRARESESSNVVSRPVDAERIEFRRVDGVSALSERAENLIIYPYGITALKFPPSPLVL